MKTRSLGVTLVTILLATWALLPFFVLFPSQIGAPSQALDFDFVVVCVMAIIVIAITFVASRKQDPARIRLLRNLAIIAVTSTVASLLLSLDIRFPKFYIRTPHILTPMLGVDGESAYDADVFELYCELWLCVGGIIGAVTVVLRKLSSHRLMRP
jgi:hypothetical protein